MGDDTDKAMWFTNKSVRISLPKEVLVDDFIMSNEQKK